MDLFPAHLAASSCCHVQPNNCQRVAFFNKKRVLGRSLNAINRIPNKSLDLKKFQTGIQCHVNK